MLTATARSTPSDGQPDTLDPDIPWATRVWSRLLVILAGYYVVAALTLPFAGAVWIGELPVLAVLQLPKLLVAELIRKPLAAQYAKEEPPKHRSFSPHYI